MTTIEELGRGVLACMNLMLKNGFSSTKDEYQFVFPDGVTIKVKFSSIDSLNITVENINRVKSSRETLIEALKV